jgi:superfamily II DNA/RNA helicase
VPFENKFDLVASIAAREGRTLCFVRTKHGADRLARNLAAAGVAAAALHGGRTQAQRTKALDAFKDGSVPVLVATDVAARGIHVDGVSLVLHVDPPADPKDYLHRAGRTARAGESGTVVTMVTSSQRREVDEMTRRAGVRARTTDVAPGGAALVGITGARPPSGVALTEPPKPKPQRAARPKPSQATRPKQPRRRRAA